MRRPAQPALPLPMKVHARPTFEPLEPRRLFASVFANINVSQTAGNHAEGTIVVDPTDPSRLFTASNAPGVGLLAAISSDGGATWARRAMADDEIGNTGLAADGLAPACCDPSAAFDRFGNLYLVYARDADHGVNVVRSTDAGATFSTVARFDGDLDQPTVATGPDSVWVTFKRGSLVAAAGAPVTGLGSTVAFGAPAVIPGSGRGNFGDIAVGAQGQVAVTYQQGSRISVSVDPDGLGPARFGRKVVVTRTHVGGFDRIAAQSSRGIDAEAALVYDRGAGAFAGRLYLLYTDEQPDGSDNTEVMLRYSADGGVTWGAPMRVNSDTSLSSQFLPRAVVDDATGDLYVAWLDTRYDAGDHSPDDTDGLANDDPEVFATRASPDADGMFFSILDLPVSQAPSNARPADSSIDLGDYIGLAFGGDTLYPLWADNSNSTGDNPDGAGSKFDQYTARVSGQLMRLNGERQLTLRSVPGGFQAIYTPGKVSPGGRPDYRFRVTYTDPSGIDPSSLNDGNILVE